MSTSGPVRLSVFFEFDPSSKVSVQVILDRIHPEDTHTVKMALDAVAIGTGIDFECRLQFPDRRIKHLHIVGKAERDVTGSIEIIGAVMDITAQKLTEVELRRSKAHLIDAQRLSHTGSAGMEAGTKRMFWSEETARIYGYAPETEPTPELILQRVHPDDVELLKNVLERAGQAGSDFNFEHRLLMPDGVALIGLLLAHEKEVIEAELAQTHGRTSRPAGAATKLGIPDSTLETKIQRLGIDKYRFKSKVR